VNRPLFLSCQNQKIHSWYRHVSGTAKKLLELYLKNGRKSLVFASSTGAPMEPDNFVKRNFKKVLDKAKEKRTEENLAAIGKVRWRDFRYTFGSLKIDQGEALLYVSRQKGHSRIQVTADICAHQIRAKRPDAAAKTDAMISGKENVIVPY
jgi:hypothetical protein